MRYLFLVLCFTLLTATGSRLLSQEPVNNAQTEIVVNQGKYQSDLLAMRNMILKKDRQLLAENLRRQQLLFFASLAVLMLTSGLLVMVYQNNRHKQKANMLLKKQKNDIQLHCDQIDQALTELKDAQIKLIQKEKMASLGELTAGIAHEIQNPLNFVNNFSEVSSELVDELREGPFLHLPESQQDYATEILGDLAQNLQKITLHGKRADSIVKGMLEHSRSSSGFRQSTDINTLAAEYLKLAYHGQRAKDPSFIVHLITHFYPEIALVEVVQQDMGRVLLNLFNNAFYAVQERQNKSSGAPYTPTVTVSTLRQHGQVKIQIRDNGTGIPESVIQKIFQPFFTTKPAGQGTGLGLSLSYDIVTKGHGGQMEVESRVGEGTVMTVAFL